MLRAHSRLVEQVMLAGDLLLVAGCWLLAYYIRFYVAGPPSSHGIPYVQPYLLMLVPILVVWGVSFRAFDLYRPRRIGSRLSEIADIAKASSVGALVLVSVMSFLFREYDYSRVVIVYFWILSIAAVSFSRYPFRQGLPVAPPRGYNPPHAPVVGGGELAAAVIQRLRARPDTGIRILGLVADEKRSQGGAQPLGGFADLRSVLDAHPVDHVIVALAHEDSGRLGGLLEAIGDEPVTIHVVPDLGRFTSLRGGVDEFDGLPFVPLPQSPPSP